MPKGRLQSIVRRLKDRIALNRRAFILYSILRALVLVTLIRCLMTQRWEGVAISILVLVLFLVPSLVEGMAHIEIPGLFQAIIYSLIINFIRTPPTFIRTCADECGNPIP